MDIEKLFKEFVEKEWHDGHEPQGGHDHYEEEEVELDEKTYYNLERGVYEMGKEKHDRKKEVKQGYPNAIEVKSTVKQAAATVAKLNKEEVEEAKLKKKKKDKEFQFGISAKGGWSKGLAKHREEVEEDLNLIAVSEDMCDVNRGDLGSDVMKAAWDKKCGSGDKKKKPQTALQKVSDKVGAGKMYNDFDPFIEEALGEGYKDLPPHLQKLIKKIEKKQKDWNKQNPNAKIKTLVYNPETGKPDIEVKENTMKLEDTVLQVLEGKKKKAGAYEDNTNDKSDDGEGLDKVQPKAVKKKFKDRKDKDIDNDGDVDDSDKFLHKRRKAVSKAVSKEEKSYSKLFNSIMTLMRRK